MWYKEALCRKGGWPLDFFFERYENEPNVAKVVDELCSSCPFRDRCLEEEVRSKGTGAFGGVYIVEGKYSREFNAHKSPEDVKLSRKRVSQIRRNRV